MVIIDIDIPDNCDECRFNTEYGFCKAMPDNFCGNTDDRKRPKWCPLKEQEADKPKGHWIEKEDYNMDTYYDCSVCGESWTTIDGTPWQNGMNYCPHCGAKMET